MREPLRWPRNGRPPYPNAAWALRFENDGALPEPRHETPGRGHEACSRRWCVETTPGPKSVPPTHLARPTIAKTPNFIGGPPGDRTRDTVIKSHFRRNAVKRPEMHSVQKYSIFLGVYVLSRIIRFQRVSSRCYPGVTP